MQVDFNAKNEYDFINNYKLLQAAFLKLNVNKVNLLTTWVPSSAGRFLAPCHLLCSQKP